jgi:hypothetical protein
MQRFLILTLSDHMATKIFDFSSIVKHKFSARDLERGWTGISLRLSTIPKNVCILETDPNIKREHENNVMSVRY